MQTLRLNEQGWFSSTNPLTKPEGQGRTNDLQDLFRQGSCRSEQEGKRKIKKIYRKMVSKPPPLSTSQGADYALRVLEQSVRQPRDLVLTPQGVRVL